MSGRIFRLNPAVYFMNRAMIALMGLTVLSCFIPCVDGLVSPRPYATSWQFLAMEFALLGLASFVIFFTGYFYLAERKMRVVMEEEGLRLHYSAFSNQGKLFPWSSFPTTEVRLACFPADWKLRPVTRKLGFGSDRLNDGTKALVFVLKDHVPFVYLPTTENLVLMLQLEKPEEFLELFGKQAVADV